MPQTILVTGATSGFGKSIATRFARQGWNVIITGRRQDRLNELAATLRSQFHVSAMPLLFDVRDFEAVRQALESLPDDLTIDVLVNNAGLASGLSSIEDGDINDWEVMIDTNVKGLLYVTRLIAPRMKAKRHGHIINIGSTAAKTVYKNGNVYCATKFAVDALTQSTRIDLLPYGIKVTGIHPGMAETEFSIVRFKGDTERAAKVYDDVTPLSGDDIAETVWYCATLPQHVCINDLTITCLNQANAIYVVRDAEKSVE